jgi:hypothetical protein
MAFSEGKNQDPVSATKLLIESIFYLVLCVGTAVCAQAQSVQPNSTDESWTAATQTSAENTNPSRTMESHIQSGNRSVDKQRVEVLGPDGRYQPHLDTEKETIRVNATTTHTVESTYSWDGNGQRKLALVTEEEAQTSANGDVQVVRTTSSSDVNGQLQVVQREVANTKKTSPDAQETKTTVYLSDGNGGFTTARQTEELQKRSADNQVEVKKTTLLPDGNGNWEVGEVRKATIKEDDNKRATEEQVSQPDLDGRLSELSRTVSEENKTGTGKSSSTVDTYSTVVPGVAGDGRLHLNQRVTTVQKKDSDRETTEQQVEQANPDSPNASLQVRAKTKYVVHYAASGREQTKTTQASDVNGAFNVVSVETQKLDQVPPAQASDKPQ